MYISFKHPSKYHNTFWKDATAFSVNMEWNEFFEYICCEIIVDRDNVAYHASGYYKLKDLVFVNSS